MVSVFTSLLQNDQLVDVTLLAENNEIHAHKIVLSACSPYFQVRCRHSPHFLFCRNHNTFNCFHGKIIYSVISVAVHTQSVQASSYYLGRCKVYLLEKSGRVYVQW